MYMSLEDLDGVLHSDGILQVPLQEGPHVGGHGDVAGVGSQEQQDSQLLERLNPSPVAADMLLKVVCGVPQQGKAVKRSMAARPAIPPALVHWNMATVSGPMKPGTPLATQTNLQGIPSTARPASAMHSCRSPPQLDMTPAWMEET